MKRIASIASALIFATGLAAPGLADELTAKEAQALYEKAYIYGLPIIMSYKTMYFYSVDDSTAQYKAPFNQIKNTARVYGPKDTAVVSANSDTPYSLLWMDLRAEPVVLCVPKIDKKRYFSVMIQDLSTNLMPYIGSRTTGNDAGCYAVAGPDWSGDKPGGVEFVENAATDFVFAVYRTQLFSADDLDNVKKIQTGYKVQTLSTFAGTDTPTPATPVTPLKWHEKGATGNDFIKFLNFTLQFIHPSEAEKKLLDDLSIIGVGAGKEYDFASLATDAQADLTAGIKSAHDKIEKQIKAGWGGNTAKGYDNNWLARAATTQQGWGANLDAEAAYPTYSTDGNGNALDASANNYTITFSKDQQPPVNSFWSLTMYDGKTQLMIDNPINRYLLNSAMLSDMKTGDDGSLTLYIQKDSPSDALKANWLPAPDGPFYMLMRLYWPKKEFLDGKWTPPAATKAK